MVQVTEVVVRAHQVLKGKLTVLKRMNGEVATEGRSGSKFGKTASVCLCSHTPYHIASRYIAALLSDANELVMSIRNRSFISRILRSGSDADGLRELTEKLVQATQMLTAGTAVEVAEDVKAVQSEISRALKEAKLFSRSEVESMACQIAGVDSPDALTIEVVEAVMKDEKSMKTLYAGLGVGEKILIAEVRAQKVAVETSMAHMAAKIDLLMEQASRGSSWTLSILVLHRTLQASLVGPGTAVERQSRADWAIALFVKSLALCHAFFL